jgi:hypothetical protein
MKFTLTIELGNDAMQTADDIGKALLGVGRKLRFNHSRSEEMDVFDRSGGILDENGNRVGKWSIK